MSSSKTTELVSEIDKIYFGIYSPEEVKKLAITRIFNSKMNGPNSIYDEAMGCIDNGKKCISCGLDNKECAGHFGYIELNYDIIHPLYYKMVVSFLKVFCVKCSNCMMSKDQLELNGFFNFRGERRFNMILERCEKIDICPNCNNPQPKISFVISESNIYMIHRENGEDIKTQLSEKEIKNIFENVSNESVELIGLNSEQIHPKNLIISNLLVLPPVARPYVVADGITCDDDLTIQYLEIIKTNNNLEDVNLAESKRIKNIQSLKFRVKCLFDNSAGKARHSNGRPTKCIKKRLTGKEGQIRNNLMGKRVNKSARTVIGPDPTLKLGQIAVPEGIAKILTYPVRVNRYNMDELTSYVNSGKANFVLRGDIRINLKYAMFRKGTELLHNDEIIRDDKKIVINYNNFEKVKLQEGDKLIRNGKEISELVYPSSKNFNLQYGDIVERQLKNGDIVLLNRQPTLHKGSMLAQEIVVRPGKTIRMNLAINKTFNADFDF